MLKPQDVVILCKLITINHVDWQFRELAKMTGISLSEVHESIKRSAYSSLFSSARKRVNTNAFEEFIIHGLKYTFPYELVSISRGIPTAYSAPPLKDRIVYEENDIYVWPFAEGEERGIGLKPLYPSVPLIVLKDRKLYEILSLIETLRIGKAREINIAKEEFHQRIRHYNEAYSI